MASRFAQTVLRNATQVKGLRQDRTIWIYSRKAAKIAKIFLWLVCVLRTGRRIQRSPHQCWDSGVQ